MIWGFHTLSQRWQLWADISCGQWYYQVKHTKLFVGAIIIIIITGREQQKSAASTVQSFQELTQSQLEGDCATAWLFSIGLDIRWWWQRVQHRQCATLFISYFQASQGSRLMSNIREKEGDTACYRGEALWLDTEGEVVHPLSLFLLLNLIFYCFTFSSSCWLAVSLSRGRNVEPGLRMPTWQEKSQGGEE